MARQSDVKTLAAITGQPSEDVVAMLKQYDGDVNAATNALMDMEKFAVVAKKGTKQKTAAAPERRPVERRGGDKKFEGKDRKFDKREGGKPGAGKPFTKGPPGLPAPRNDAPKQQTKAAPAPAAPAAPLVQQPRSWGPAAAAGPGTPPPTQPTAAPAAAPKWGGGTSAADIVRGGPKEQAQARQAAAPKARSGGGPAPHANANNNKAGSAGARPLPKPVAGGGGASAAVQNPTRIPAPNFVQPAVPVREGWAQGVLSGAGAVALQPQEATVNPTGYADPNAFGFGFDGRQAPSAAPPAPAGARPGARPAPAPKPQPAGAASGGLGLQFGHFGQGGVSDFNGFGGGFQQQQQPGQRPQTAVSGAGRPQTAQPPTAVPQNSFQNSLAGQAAHAQAQRRSAQGQVGVQPGLPRVTLPDDLSKDKNVPTPTQTQGYYAQVPQQQMGGYAGYPPNAYDQQTAMAQQQQYGAQYGFDQQYPSQQQQQQAQHASVGVAAQGLGQAQGAGAGAAQAAGATAATAAAQSQFGQNAFMNAGYPMYPTYVPPGMPPQYAPYAPQQGYYGYPQAGYPEQGGQGQARGNNQYQQYNSGGGAQGAQSAAAKPRSASQPQNADAAQYGQYGNEQFSNYSQYGAR